MKSSLLFLLASLPVLSAPADTDFHIPAGPLEGALKAFEQQSGRPLERDAHALEGHRVPELRGRFLPEEALRRLLAGTGFAFQPQGKGFRLTAPEALLPPVTVRGRNERDAGRTELDAKAIAERPLLNRGMADLLETRPGVRLDNGAHAGTNRGSLEQPEISFHGTDPTQNLFMIDGADGTSHFDPARKNANIQIGNVPSNSQAYYVDPALLGSVVIHDHDVPVEFGRFQGGVVDARLGRATGRNRNTLGFEHSRSNWVNTRVGALDQRSFDLGQPGFTPDWRKSAIGLTVDQKFGNQWGLIGGLSRRTSNIRRQGDSGPVTTRNQVDNLLAKVTHWSSGLTTHDLTVKASRSADEYVSDFFVDSRWTNHHDASGLAYDLEHQTGLGKLEVRLGYDTFNSRRTSNKPDFVVHVLGRTQWSEVGFGTERTGEDTLALKAAFRFLESQAGSFTHKLLVGVDAKSTRAAFERENQASSYNEYRANANAAPLYRNRIQYAPGKAKVDFSEQALFLSEDLSRGSFTFTAGLRLDRDSFLERTNLAPRLLLAYRLGGDPDRVLSLGHSRYYGSGMLAMAVQEAKAWMVTRLTDSTGKPYPGSTLPAPSLYGGLRTPYTDETTLNYVHRLPSVKWTFTALQRDGKDQVNAEAVAATATQAAGQRYLNNGRSTTRSLMLEWEALRSWRFLGAAWGTKGSLNWMHAERNHDLLGSYNSDILYDKVYHNGHLIDATALPPSDYNQPWKADAQLVGQWAGPGLQLHNTLRWTGRYQTPFYRGVNKQDGYRIYEDAPVGGHLIWDLTLGWAPPALRQVEFRLTVENVLDRVPVLEASDPALAFNRDTYGSGRGFQAQVKFTF